MVVADRTVRVVVTVFHAIAISLTIFRLSYRGYMRRFWWEDAWASLGLVSDMLCLLCTWLQILPGTGYNDMPINNIASNWILAIAFTSVLWSARMSILCSIIRVGNPDLKHRRFAIGVAIAFGVMWIGLMAQKLNVCYHHQCMMTRNVAISQLITDCIADTVLVALPFRLLQGVKLSRNRRILICCAFSASFLITAVTIIHTALLFGTPSIKTTFVAHGKAALSLVVCNTLVIVTFSYRVFRRNGSHDLDDSCPGSGTMHFTTIDLTHLTNSRAVASAAEAIPTPLSTCQMPDSHSSDGKSVISDSDGYRQA
ncbi:hypothetical protein BJ138DRAFT_670414 [Hygrophoropsis aurantiaca]|uniref:Uncharacterized protein n=1 Tax=Hygrophoropsis aurantiaca TaxID=72124 RepID=A0ACB8AIK7_9AGAM|nr:hypothetical protein BJ138DRAFT_670414 [Hygrophoropsis aurantiaca]